MRKWFVGIAVLAACAASAAIALAQSGPSLTLYEGVGYSGDTRLVDRAVPDLDRLRFNDSARSLVAEGRWEVCLDASFRGQCRVVQGHVSDMGDWNGSISSARYLGPADWGSVGAHAGAGDSRISSPAPSTQVEAWRPMFRTDLFGGDYHEFDLSAGQDWSACRAACEADGRCQSWTMTIPGSTPHGRCYLKNSVPTPNDAECCVSGIKGAASSGGHAARDPARGASREPSVAERAAQRAGQATGEEVERRVHDQIREGIGRLF